MQFIILSVSVDVHERADTSNCLLIYWETLLAARDATPRRPAVKMRQ